MLAVVSQCTAWIFQDLRITLAYVKEKYVASEKKSLQCPMKLTRSFTEAYFCLKRREEIAGLQPQAALRAPREGHCVTFFAPAPSPSAVTLRVPSAGPGSPLSAIHGLRGTCASCTSELRVRMFFGAQIKKVPEGTFFNLARPKRFELLTSASGETLSIEGARGGAGDLG